MAYDFKSLSPADFEDLARDLVGKELGVRFEAFSAGPDDGIDGRHASATGNIVLQAKHYAGSDYSTLKSKMKIERLTIDKLAPSRYIFVTSHPLTPSRKTQIAEIIGIHLQSESDIFGPEDLNALLRKFPEIEKSYIKLWLTGAGVLTRVFQAASYEYNNITVKEIDAKVRVFAPNQSLNQAQETLERTHIVIISGAPGVGKTTLAEMLSYAHIAEGWELHAIRSLDDGFKSIDDTKKQVFLFDDFLGKVALDRQALSHKDSDLSKFLQRVRTSPHARFILTTRAHIFEEARRVSEYLADQRLDISKYVLDVGVYTRRIKARILYNHLLVAQTPQTHISALVMSADIAKIVDHKNYNPRIVEWMTDAARIQDIKSEQYSKAFVEALNNPLSLWDIAFRNHIAKRCQHLLFVLFFGSEYGVNIDDLKEVYDRLHPCLCAKYAAPHDPKDFEESLRILEGGFITISNRDVRFVNPSLRDYLTEYLKDASLLNDFPACAHRSEWARKLWQHVSKLVTHEEDLGKFAQLFLAAAERFLTLPVWRRIQSYAGYHSLQVTGISNTDRLDLLLTWWTHSRNTRFAELALSLAGNPVEGFDTWRDGDEAIEIIHKIRDGDYYEGLPFAKEIADKMEAAYISMLERGVPSDDIEKIANAAQNWSGHLGSDVIKAIGGAVSRQFEDVQDIVSEIDSESSLNDHIKTLRKLAAGIQLSEQKTEAAVKIVESRIEQLQEEEDGSQAKSPSFSSHYNKDVDKFDDRALQNLFVPLLEL
jgi:energy-coupling factor transporter ATP-binding protein EcfA2